MEYISLGDERADICVLTPVCDYDREDFETEYSLILNETGARVRMCGFVIGNPNDMLSPWRAEKVFAKGDDFGCGAARTLEQIESDILPRLGNRRYILSGYSLSGLFALWCGYESEKFAAVNACSPSVWFEGWEEYIKPRPFGASCAYLSIGDREHITKNKAFARSAEKLRLQYEDLAVKLGADNCTLVQNPGNHFAECAQRTAKGIAWCVRRLV